jgi:hypothetical protein
MVSRFNVLAFYNTGFPSGQVTGFGSGAKAGQDVMGLSRHVGMRGLKDAAALGFVPC